MTNRQPHDKGFDRSVLGDALDDVPDAVIVVDPDGIVVYWNAGAERIFGFTPADALGATLDLIVPERLRERHWSGFTNAVATGTSRYGPDELLSVPAQTSDGRTVSIEFTISMVRRDGAVAYVAAILRDVTARRARESELRRRITELETTNPGS